MKPSTRNLSAIPDIAMLKKQCKAIAAMEVILSPNWEYRYYSYNNQWAEGEEVFFMKDGSGDEFLILFNSSGAVINGFAHESEMSGWKGDTQTIWEGVVDNLPIPFHKFVFGEPVRSIGTTFCIWSMDENLAWQIGDITFPANDYGDGSEDLLAIFSTATAYKEWAMDYYETYNWDAFLVDYFSEHQVITKEDVAKINPDFEDWEILKNDLNEIGYPHQI